MARLPWPLPSCFLAPSLPWVPTTSEGEGSEGQAVLGFRVPITCEHKKLDHHIQWLGVPTKCWAPTTSVGARGEGSKEDKVVRAILY